MCFARRYLLLTRLSLGFFLFASADAFLAEEARTAPASRIPGSRAIFASSALKPGCDLGFATWLSLQLCREIVYQRRDDSLS